MAKRLIPLFDRVLVEKLQPPTKSVGGILLPETAAKMAEGKVVAVGAGARSPTSGELQPLNVKEGDKVLLPNYGGTQVMLDERELYLYREEDLLGVLTG